MLKIETCFFSSEGTSCIHCPQNGYPFQLHRPTEISKSALWTMMVLSTRSCSPVTKREPTGPMLQTKSTSTFSRRSGANGLSAIKSKPRHLGEPHLHHHRRSSSSGWTQAQGVISGSCVSLITSTGIPLHSSIQHFNKFCRGGWKKSEADDLHP